MARSVVETDRLALVMRHLMAALAAVAATDLVTTLSATLASRFADTLGLVLKPPPFVDTTLTLTLVCSHVRASDPFLGWVREAMRAVAGNSVSPPQPSDSATSH